jgi:CRISPR-associated protein Cas1
MKKTLCFSNPAYLRAIHQQLEIELPASNGQAARKTTIPFEDIGVVVLEHPQITVSHVALASLLEQNAAVITCNDKFLPTGLLLSLDGNSLQSRRFREQTEATLPLKKQMWQQTVRHKIENQASVLELNGTEAKPLLRWQKEVRSGDPDNIEARAAAWYWPRLFSRTDFPWNWADNDDPDSFVRERYGEWPNCLLNYGYAVLRAVVARALVGAGLLPTLGIHHRNQYNAYCLADDIMEPYRPFVDQLVCQILNRVRYDPDIAGQGPSLSPALKKELLQIPVLDVRMERQVKPLQLAAQRTAASVFACFSGQDSKIVYPDIC